MKHIIIIGGGITGLAAAYRLEMLTDDVAITLVEREVRLGGKILTERVDGFVIEGAPDSFLSRKPRGIGLCEELGLTAALQGRRPGFEKTFVWRHGALHRLPSGLTGLIPTNLEALTHSTLISAEGKARLAQEPELPPAPLNGDESVANFVTRRLGREVYEGLVEPLMSGIYAGNGDQLSLAATFPQLRQLELKHGSLLRGLGAGSKGQGAKGKEGQSAIQNYPPFVSFQGGMGVLVEAILERLQRTTLVLGRSVQGVTKAGKSGYAVLLDDEQNLTADALIIATPAFATARLLADLDPALATLHAEIPHASSAIITLAYAEADLPQPLDGYGYVIPQVEGTDILACTWTSSKWEGRAPTGYGLMRVYAGRYGRRDVTKLVDAELLELARAEVQRVLGITAQPSLTRIHRWPGAMPQYVLGHPERLTQIEAQRSRHNGLFLAGAAYRGVGIPDCIESGEAAARAAVQYLLS